MASQLEGVANALAQLKAAGQVSEERVLRQTVRAAAKPVLREMESRAPVGAVMHETYKGRLVAPGFLRRSVRMVVTRIKNGAGSVAAIFGVRKEAFYGVSFVERGTVKQRAQEWLASSLESKSAEAIDKFSDAVLLVLKRVSAKARRQLGLSSRQSKVFR
jgi:HK97 gp10 family phage protein